MRYVKGKVRSCGRVESDYIIRDGEPMVPHVTVDDHEAAGTGLIWTTGEPIMRISPPIGFGRNEEW